MFIEQYIQEYQNKELCRFITCGSVDDGKSTLIGRFLYDTKKFKEKTKEEIDFASLVDGLESEIEQGITIDVAYRFFSSSKRNFIIADTPGHEQYTRNMVTGASTADIAIILIDASKGIRIQTKRHTYLVDLLGIKHIIVAINKMDLIDFSQEKFEAIVSEYQELIRSLNIQASIYFIPISALYGDNIVYLSTKISWYQGQTLLDLLENIELHTENEDFRFLVQYINCFEQNRKICGNIAGGQIEVGDRVIHFPSLKTSKVKSIIHSNGRNHTLASYQESISLELEDQLDISRGDLICKTLPIITDRIKAMIIWMSEEKLQFDVLYLIKRSTTLFSAKFQRIIFKKNLQNLENFPCDNLFLNDIGLCEINFQESVALDFYSDNKTMGSFIIIDKYSNQTLGAGIIIENMDSQSDFQRKYTQSEIALNQFIRLHYPEWECKKI